MTREQELMHSFVELADTLVDEFDVVDLLTRLSERCVALLGVSAAGVMLASPGRDLRLVASSSEAMRVVETFELQAQEGPCLDAFRTGQEVEHENLVTGAGRWPRLATVAVQAGFQSASALPMRVRDHVIGALNLFSTKVVRMSEEERLIARAFADLASISVVQHRASAEARLLNEQLTYALRSRVLIEQAKGVIFERLGIDMEEAFSRMRAYARNHNLLLTDVARAAIDGSLDDPIWVKIAP
ncbi:MAG: GAF and ANTAR domain-containing protein [Acidimicrobiales bacterium]